MKKIIFFLALPLVFFACQQNQDEEIERLNLEKQALREQMIQKDSTLNNFFNSLNQIEENLQAIKETEGRISQGAGSNLEGRQDLLDVINDDVRTIGELMERNRQLISQLNRDFNSSSDRIEELDKMLARLNNQLEEKEVEIQILRSELMNMNVRVEYLTATVDTLEETRRRQQQQIDEATLELNTAYFAMGSQAELLNQGIIVRDGGFLGIGRSSKLNSDFNQSYFTRIDITHTPEITIPGKKPALISSHPEDSWRMRFDGDIYFLEILDHSKFWSTSRHLVIEMQ